MNTKTSNWVRRLAGITTLLMVSMSFVGQASARILFQDDTVGVWESDQLQVGSNDAGAVNTSVQFGADVTPAENGVINWNITTNTFEVDHTVAVTGGLSATGQVNFSGAAGTRIRESSDPATLAACATTGELILDTTDKEVQICTVIGGAGAATWVGVGAGTLNGLTSGQFLRSDASSALTTGNTLTFNSGSTFNVNGVANIGDGGDAITVNSNTWDVSGAGVGSGFTGFTSTGAIDFSGATSFLMTQGAANPGTCTEGSLFYNTTDNSTYVCTATNTFTSLAAGTMDFEAVYGTDADKSLSITDNLATGFEIKEGANSYIKLATTNGSELITLTPATTVTGTLTANGTLAANGVVTIGDGGDTVAINSSDWDINATGDMTNIGAITMDGLLTGTLGATITGAAVNLNASSNFATNIGTGTTTSTVSIGGGANNVAINSSTWDITGAGAASGFTTVGASGNFTTSGGSFCVGTTCLNETNATGDNGATLIGVDTTTINNSASTTVQGVLEDFGNLVGSNAPNVEQLTFHPEYPDTVVWPDTTNNAGTLSSLYDDPNNENYYHWTSNNAVLQDMDLKFRFVLPTDFLATGNLTFRYRTGSAVTTDNKVDMTIFNATDLTTGNPTQCGTSATNVNAAAWATGTITAGTINTGCTGATALNAGDLIEIDVKLYDNSGGADFADVGYVSLAYTN